MSHVTASSVASAPAAAFDSAALDELDDAELCEMLVGLFAGEAAIRIEQIGAAVADGEAATLAHRLEGAAATIGAQRVAQLCAALAASPSPGEVARLHDQLADALDDALRAMDAYLERAHARRPR